MKGRAIIKGDPTKKVKSPNKITKNYCCFLNVITNAPLTCTDVAI